jgi:small-conductance mechanosensitive channel
VGVSYSTDIPLAMELITKAAESSTRIYKFRQPKAQLTDFGNSSIDLRVVFWIKDPEFGVDNIKSEIRLEIWKLFKEHKIEIPFPQNDVYIKSMPDNPVIN